MKKTKLLSCAMLMCMAVSLTACGSEENKESNIMSDFTATKQEETMTETTTETTTEETTEAITEDRTEADTADATDETGTEDIQEFTNSGGNYVLKLDNYTSFIETTSESNVNNEDGLEVCHYNTYITIQRYGREMTDMTIDEFIDYVDNHSMDEYILRENDLELSNSAIINSKIQYMEMDYEGTIFYAYVFFLETDEGLYHILLTGGEKDIFEHYIYFINDMEFK